MIFTSRQALVNFSLKATLSAITTLLILNTTIVNAQYGGTVNTNPTNSGAKFTTSQTSNSTSIAIESGKKNDVLSIILNNTTNAIYKIRFTLNSDINNGLVVLSKIDNSQLLSDLPGNPITSFSISLKNINYEQIGNFAFDFSIKNENIDRLYSAYSSNSPWASAGISQPYAINSGQDLQFTGSTNIAFKQFTLTASAKSNQGAVLGQRDNSNVSASASLVRTGQKGYNIFSLGILSMFFIVSTYLILKSNSR